MHHFSQIFPTDPDAKDRITTNIKYWFDHEFSNGTSYIVHKSTVLGDAQHTTGAVERTDFATVVMTL